MPLNRPLQKLHFDVLVAVAVAVTGAGIGGRDRMQGPEAGPGVEFDVSVAGVKAELVYLLASLVLLSWNRSR
jgi:hypothetical protein